jgi:ubiquitin C-terminal hydrolase
VIRNLILDRNPAVGKRTSNSSTILNPILQHLLQAQELQTVEKPKVSYISLHWARHPSGSNLFFFLFFDLIKQIEIKHANATIQQ